MSELEDIMREVTQKLIDNFAKCEKEDVKIKIEQLAKQLNQLGNDDTVSNLKIFTDISEILNIAKKNNIILSLDVKNALHFIEQDFDLFKSKFKSLSSVAQDSLMVKKLSEVIKNSALSVEPVSLQNDDLTAKNSLNPVTSEVKASPKDAISAMTIDGSIESEAATQPQVLVFSDDIKRDFKFAINEIGNKIIIKLMLNHFGPECEPLKSQVKEHIQTINKFVSSDGTFFPDIAVADAATAILKLNTDQRVNLSSVDLGLLNAVITDYNKYFGFAVIDISERITSISSAVNNACKDHITIQFTDEDFDLFMNGNPTKPHISVDEDKGRAKYGLLGNLTLTEYLSASFVDMIRRAQRAAKDMMNLGQDRGQDRGQEGVFQADMMFNDAVALPRPTTPLLEPSLEPSVNESFRSRFVAMLFYGLSLILSALSSALLFLNRLVESARTYFATPQTPPPQTPPQSVDVQSQTPPPQTPPQSVDVQLVIDIRNLLKEIEPTLTYNREDLVTKTLELCEKYINNKSQVDMDAFKKALKKAQILVHPDRNPDMPREKFQKYDELREKFIDTLTTSSPASSPSEASTKAKAPSAGSNASTDDEFPNYTMNPMHRETSKAGLSDHSVKIMSQKKVTDHPDGHGG